MPGDIRTIFDDLRQDVVNVHHKWLQFCRLYATDQDTVSLLNEVAGDFFGTIQAVMIDDIILGLSRLSDPAKTSRNTNRTLRQLRDCIDPSSHAYLLVDIDKTLSTVDVACKKQRLHRNKRIAHSDIEAQGADNLPQISFAEMKAAISAVTTTMQTVEGALWDGETAYSRPIVRGGADMLIHYLELGLMQEKEQRQLWLRRKVGDRGA